MYAVRGNSPVFHLIASEEKQTVCGLSVSESVLSQPAGSALHRTNSKPEHALLCKHCSRLAEQMDRSDTD